MAFLLIVGQLCCGVAVSAEIVAAYVYVFKAFGLQHGTHLMREPGIDFKVQASARSECPTGICRNGFIEESFIALD